MHRTELIEDLIQLINIRSVTGEPDCVQAMHKLTELAGRYGFTHEQDGELSLSILHSGTEGTRELGILGHIDVVPEGSGWKHAPFEASEQNGYVIGRGSIDNKGPVIMSLFVLRCLRELDIPLKSTVRLIAGCREETDMEDVKHYLQLHEPPAFTINCDGGWAGCIGEKGILEADLLFPAATGNLISLEGGSASNMVADHACTVIRLANGTRQVLETTGKSAHCCVPHQGENAIIKLLDQLCDDRLRQCFPDDYGTGLRIHHEDALSGKTTCVPTMIHLEDDVIRVHFNARTALSQRREQLMNTLQKRIAKLNIQLENVRWIPPRYTPPDQPEVQLLLDTCREFLNSKYKPYVMGGGTHSRYFPNSLPFGPEVLDPRIKRPFGKAHGPDEAVCIDDLLRAIKVYVIALKRLDDHFSSK